MAYQYNRGLKFDDWVVGFSYDTPSRTITEADVVNFAGLSGDFNPLHTDEEFAKKTPHGTRIAHGALVFSVSSGLRNMTGFGEGTTIAVMEMKTKYTAPVRIGDTISCHVEVLEQRPSKNPGRGVSIQSCKTLNQRGEVVCDQEMTIMYRN